MPDPQRKPVEEQFLDAIEKKVRDTSEDLQKLYNARATARQEVHELSKFLEPVLQWIMYVQYDVTNHSIDLTISGDKHVMEAVWGVLRKAGYEPDSRVKDEPISSFSTWFRLANSGYDEPNYKRLKVWFNFCSTKCRRVQTGVKMVEQPVYEVICDETIDR